MSDVLGDTLRDALASTPEPASGVAFDGVAQRRRQLQRRRVATGAFSCLAAVGVGLAALGQLPSQSHDSSTLAESPTDAAISPNVSPTVSTPSGKVEICQVPKLKPNLQWSSPQDSTLEGVLTVRNTGSEACFALLRPVVQPLDEAGRPLAVPDRQFKQLPFGPSLLAPGGTARSSVVWDNWCGASSGTRVRVSWPGGGEQVVDAGSTSVPPCSQPSTKGSISSDYFSPLTGPTKTANP